MEKEHELREIWVDLGIICQLYKDDLFTPDYSIVDALEKEREKLRKILGWEIHESHPPLAMHPKPLELLDER